MSLHGSWQVDRLEVDGELSPLVEGSSISFEVTADNRFFGKALNRLMGTFDPDASAPFGPVASTMMAGPQEIMDQERLFIVMIGAVEGFRLAGPEGGDLGSEEAHLVVGDRVVMVLSRGGTEEE